jgi:tetratricopeptide (TPR) repeat protein
MRSLWKGEPQKAHSRMESFVSLIPEGNPLPPRLRMVQGEILLRSGQHAKLQPIFDELKEKNDPAVLFWLGRTWRYLGDSLRAQLALSSALRFSPNHDPSRAQRGLLGLETSNTAMSQGDMDALFDLGIGDLGPRQAAYAKLIRSELRRIANEKDKALTDFNSIDKTFSRDPEYRLIESKRLSAQKKYKESIETLQAAIKRKPYHLQLRTALIAKAALDKNRNLADEVFQEANTIFPGAKNLVVTRIRTLGRFKKWDDALSFAQQSLKNLNKAEIHREIGRIHLVKKQYPKATKSLTKAVELSGGTSRRTKATIYILLGRTQALTKDYASAIDAYGQALKSDASYSQIYYHLAASLIEQGNVAAAKEAYEKTIELEPGSKIAKRAQKRLETLVE